GRVYCFAERDAKPGLSEPPPAGPKADTSPAEKLLSSSGVTQGFALVLGLKDGALVEGLLGRPKLHVIAIDPDATKVNSIRRRLDAKGLFDDYRLAVHVGEPESFGLPPYIASLIVTETQQKCTDAIRQLLRPYGGTSAERSGDAWKLTRREGPLAGAADWTHELADEGNLLCGRDKLVKAPLGVQWYGGAASDPRYYFNGNVGHDTRGDGVCPLPPNAEVVDGRMILQGPGILAAVDVYTGRVLWETQVPRMFVFGGKGGGVGIHSKRYPEPWKVPEALEMEVPPSQHSRTSGLNYVSMPDGIYMVAGKRLLRYDPADGRLISDRPMPLKDAPCWGNIRVSGDYLIATAFSPKDVVDARCGHDGNGGDWAKDRMKMSHLLVLDRRTGKLLWSRKAAWGFLNCGMAVGGGRVFCVDLIVEGVLEKLREAGHTFPDTPPMLYGLDLRTGKEVWSYRTDALVKHLAYSKERDILVAPCRNLMEWKEGTWADTTKDTRRGKGGRNRPGRMRGFSGRDGTVLWEVEEAPYFEPHIIVHDLIIDRYAGTYDLRTGKRHERVSPLTGQPETWTFRRGGCNHLVAGENLVTWRTAYYDLAGMSGVVPLTGMDAGCTPTFIPGGGILTAGNFGIHYKRSCTTAMALVHRPDGEVWTSYVSQRSRDSSIGNGPIRRAGFNFAAPGDRRAKDGTLWLAITARKAENVAVRPKEVQWFGVHPARADSWVVASGVKGASEITIPTVLWGGKRQPRSDGQGRPYTVRLHFAEPEPLEPGGRILNVSLEGKPVLRDFDIAKAAGGTSKAV
ncbi:MAG: PQQ-binding-like beta-propeller repeat protein, partial [Phycisphaerae bacterium]